MILVVVLSIILNIIFYSIDHSMLAIALATLVTYIIWFIYGEYDFKKYKMKLNGYIYFVIILLLFTICSIMNNTICGFIIYTITALIISFILLKNQVLTIYNEGLDYIKKFINKKNNKNIKF